MKVYDIVPGLEFNPELDFELSPAWFLAAAYSIPPWTPLFGWFFINFARHGLQYGAEKLSIPTVKGWDWRFRNGGAFITVLPVKSKEEIEKREALFKKNILPFIEDYDGIWDKYKDEMMERYAGLKSLDLDNATNIELLENFEETINTHRRMFEIHFVMQYPVYTAFTLFENMCREVAGIDDTSPEFHDLVRGFDNRVFQTDRCLWEFSVKAKEDGLADIFLENEPHEIKNSLESTEKGQAFMKDFMAFLEEDGWRTQRMATIDLPTWREDPVPPLSNIKQFLEKGGGFNLDEERKLNIAKREKAEKDVLSKVPEEQKVWFEKLMRLSQKCCQFSKDHEFYLDLYCHALIRRSALSLGKRFAQHGAIDEREDIMYLIPDEIRKAAINPDMYNMRSIVERRKSEREEWLKDPNPPFMFKEGVDLDQAMGMLIQSRDPVALKVIVGSMPNVRPELKADLYGTCGSPGIAEGPAKVILSEKELSQVQNGDILVARNTSVSWTPVFSLLKGVVVDRGASLSHAAIVGREYNIPVVMNTFEGTAKIKTGQRIKVDANLGAVYILDN